MSESDPSRQTDLRLAERAPRARIRPPRDLFPTEPWSLSETRFEPRFLEQLETIYALGNGFLGLRGDFEEAMPVSKPGVVLNGFYETWPIVYGEEAYGYARTGQTIVNVTDGKIIRLYVDDEPLEINKSQLLHFRRKLDWRSGTLDREILWETSAGQQIEIKSRRMVSMVHRHLALLTYEVRCLNRAAHVTLSSEMMTRKGEQARDDDPRVSQGFDGRVLIPELQEAEDRRVVLCHPEGALATEGSTIERIFSW